MKAALTGGALMLSAALAVGVCEAAPVAGTGSIDLMGVSDGPLGPGVTFSFVLGVLQSGTGDFSALPEFSLVYPSPIIATLGSAVSFDGLFGSFVGTVSALELTSSSEAVMFDVDALGTFTPGGSLSGLEASAMSLTLRAEQLSGGVFGRFAFSFSTSPGTHGVPAPATAGLVAAALAGLLLSRRAVPLRA
jgi:hypothetical protein